MLHDEPANDFVMELLGEVTRLNGIKMRPHDIEISAVPGLAGATPGYVLRVLRGGFEVPATLTTEAWDEVTVVLTRTHAQAIGLEEHTKVWLTPAVCAAVVPAMAAG